MLAQEPHGTFIFERSKLLYSRTRKRFKTISHFVFTALTTSQRNRSAADFGQLLVALLTSQHFSLCGAGICHRFKFQKISDIVLTGCFADFVLHSDSRNVPVGIIDYLKRSKLDKHMTATFLLTARNLQLSPLINVELMIILIIN